MKITRQASFPLCRQNGLISAEHSQRLGSIGGLKPCRSWLAIKWDKLRDDILKGWRLVLRPVYRLVRGGTARKRCVWMLRSVRAMSLWTSWMDAVLYWKRNRTSPKCFHQVKRPLCLKWLIANMWSSHLKKTCFWNLKCFLGSLVNAPDWFVW